MEQSKKIKRSPKVGKTMKSYHLYLDDDLVAVAEAQPNKNRFFNAAIRKFINSMKNGIQEKNIKFKINHDTR